jgi:hypothetical protein
MNNHTLFPEGPYFLKLVLKKGDRWFLSKKPMVDFIGFSFVKGAWRGTPCKVAR